MVFYLGKHLTLSFNITFINLYCNHTKKLSCLISGVEFDMNDIFYEFKYLHHFLDSLSFGVNPVLNSWKHCHLCSYYLEFLRGTAYIFNQ